MNKHLILIGDQAAGKTMLVKWINEQWGFPDIRIHDEQNKASIIKHIYSTPKPVGAHIYVTNDALTYEDISNKDCLIIKLIPWK